MSEKNGASPEIGAVLQRILARLDAIEQREQQKDVIEALNSGRRGAAADDGSSAASMHPSTSTSVDPVPTRREQQEEAVEALSSGRRGGGEGSSAAHINASVDEPASDRGGPSPDPSSVVSAASTSTFLVDSLGEPDTKNKNRKHFKFMDSVWSHAFLHPGAQSSLTKADAKHANLHISALCAVQGNRHFIDKHNGSMPPGMQQEAYDMETQLWQIETELRFMVDEYAARSTKSAAAATIMLDAARARAGERAQCR